MLPLCLSGLHVQGGASAIPYVPIPGIPRTQAQTLFLRAQFSGRLCSSSSCPDRRSRCRAVAAMPDYELEAWQLEKLQGAVEQGRRHISVKTLCKELGLDRSDVLQWLKHFESTPDRVRSSIFEAQKASALAAEERQRVLADKPANARKPRERGLTSETGSEPHTAGKAPWAGNFAKKKMPRAVEATLEKVFDATPHPSQKVVASLWDLHKLPKRKVLTWFEEKRREKGVTHR